MDWSSFRLSTQLALLAELAEKYSDCVKTPQPEQLYLLGCFHAACALSGH